MYGCGIGPIVYERDRQLAARIINDCVDKITLREPDSRETLSDFGVTDPEVILASDPALTLPAAERSRIDRILREHDMDPEGKYIGFVLRKWPGIEEKATVFAAGAVYAYLKYGLTPVFLSINFRTDGEASRLVTEHLSIPYYMIDEQMSTGEVIGVLSRMTTVVSMRLHGLIFAAGQGVPLIGVAYDPKVTAFLDYVEQNNYMQFEALNEKDLSDLIDSAVALAGRGEELRRRTELLNRQEDNNRAHGRTAAWEGVNEQNDPQCCSGFRQGNKIAKSAGLRVLRRDPGAAARRRHLVRRQCLRAQARAQRRHRDRRRRAGHVPERHVVRHGHPQQAQGHGHRARHQRGVLSRRRPRDGQELPQQGHRGAAVAHPGV